MSKHPSEGFDLFQLRDWMERSEQRQRHVFNLVTEQCDFFASNLHHTLFPGRNTVDLRARNDLVTENNRSRQKEQTPCSYDGHLIWKIKNFRQQVDKLVNGELPALQSEPCFTSRYGYKYCLRLHQYRRELPQKHYRCRNERNQEASGASGLSEKSHFNE